jgi:predicted CXXCH cytochrome family protein
MKRLLAIALLAASGPAGAGSVVGSKHDFSARGPGEHRATTEPDACIFCHIAHHSSSLALSNRPETTAPHRPYESTTMSASPGGPTGSSRLCLSCHDGTIAVGQTRNGAIPMKGGDRPIAAGKRANLGTDLRRSHPVSMRASPAGKTRAPARGDAVRLDRAGLVQCTSCHDPHDEWRDPLAGKFLVKSAATLCASCHTPGSGTTTATHLGSRPIASQQAGAAAARLAARMSLSAGEAQPDAPSPAEPSAMSAANVACGACHTPHSADVRGRLMKDGRVEDDTCLSCHSGTGQKVISADLAKPSAHVTTEKGRHDAAEGPTAPESRMLPEKSPGAPRHVTCVDCHDPHSSNPQPSVAPAIPGALAGVWGIDLNGQRVAPARYEYEVCLKCHGESANKPDPDEPGLRRVRRARRDDNLRLVFGRDAVSSHPVAAPGRNPDVPSLRTPYSVSALVFCTDCHASDSGPGAGGEGARGPHGSVYPFMLERQYLTDDYTPEGPSAYALCYKCHDREILLSDGSAFPLHRRHVVERSAPCSACHAAHGISREAGNERNNAHLISFDLTIVRPGVGTGPARYDSSGPRHGSCALTCHGVTHGPASTASSY